jgi:saccharopine dehydrogenase (NADP+, L-glutamate forming)
MERGNRVLVLGAGLVTNPLIQYLLKIPGLELTVATRTVSKAENMIANHPQGKAVALDIESESATRALIEDCDLVISLVPWIYHLNVAKLAIELKKQMVTTSYVSPEMSELDAAARAAGIIILNEIGLDPGIDHMSAMKIIHQVQKDGGVVKGFLSNCGGLPAPEANTNPWGYKFSWSPRGVVLAARNTAKYLWDGKEVSVPGPELFADVHPLEVDELGAFEVYPNRDSLGYQEIYGLEGVDTLKRGTIRNLGHCATWKALADCGWFELTDVNVEGKTYEDVFAGLIGADAELPEALAAFLKIDVGADPLARMEWLGLLSAATVPGKADTTVLDVLADLLLEKLPYEKDERDMIVLQHDFDAEYPDGRKEHITSSLVAMGIPGGDSAMARTVSLPAAIATRMILEGKITETGVHIPVEPVIYEPVLEELETLDISFKETVATS